jgi:hypothetical protein
MRSARSLGLLALFAGLFAASVLHSRLDAPPIYDGIIVPPAPYRYQSPPPSVAQGNQKPLSGEGTLPVQSGQVAGGGVQTGDNQVITFWGPTTFKAPSGATSVKCTIEPLANPPAPPDGQDIKGNVYAINCSGQPGGEKVTAATTFHLTMRIPPGAVNDIRYYDGQSWHNLTTLFAPGGDPYASVNAPGFGDYAAMARTGASTSGGGGGIVSNLSRYLEFFGILLFVVIFGVIAIVQEIRRRSRRQPVKRRR